MNVEISKKQLLAILNESEHMGDIDEMGNWVKYAPHLGIKQKAGKPDAKLVSYTNDPQGATGEVEGAHWRVYTEPNLDTKMVLVGPLESEFKTNQEFYNYLKTANPGFLKDLKDHEERGYTIKFNVNWVSHKYDPIQISNAKLSAQSKINRKELGIPTDEKAPKTLPLSDYIHRSILGDANKYLTYNAKEPTAQKVTQKIVSSLLPVIVSNNLNRSKGQEKAQKQTTKTISATNDKIEWTSWNDIAWDSFDTFIESVANAKGNKDFTKGTTVNKDRQHVEKQKQKEQIVGGKVSTGNKFTILGTNIGDSFKWDVKVEFYIGIGVDLTQDEDFDYLNIPKGTVPVKTFEASAVSENAAPAEDGSITSNPEVSMALKTAMSQVADEIINSDLLGNVDGVIKKFLNPEMPADYEDWKKKNAMGAEKPAVKKKGGSGKQPVPDETLAEQKLNKMVLDILKEIKK